MPAWVNRTVAAGVTEGHLFRAINRGDKVCGERLSEKVVWQTLTIGRGGLTIDTAFSELSLTTGQGC
jgi:hypothetical protein